MRGRKGVDVDGLLCEWVLCLRPVPRHGVEARIYFRFAAIASSSVMYCCSDVPRTRTAFFSSAGPLFCPVFIAVTAWATASALAAGIAWVNALSFFCVPTYHTPAELVA